MIKNTMPDYQENVCPYYEMMIGKAFIVLCHNATIISPMLAQTKTQTRVRLWGDFSALIQET